MLILVLPGGERIPLEPYEADKTGPAFFPVAHLDVVTTRPSEGELPMSERMAIAGVNVTKQPWQL